MSHLLVRVLQDKMDVTDQVAIHEAMEQQTISGKCFIVVAAKES